MTSRQIREVLRTGKRHETLSLTLVARPRLSAVSQVACVVGKKVHPSAVVRHRYQRLLRAATQNLAKNTFVYDMVIIAKPAILTIQKLEELQKELAPLLNKLP